MGEFVYSVGWLVILAGIIFFIYSIVTKKENDKKENEILRNYSDKCKWNMNENDIKKILANPEERKKAREKYFDAENRKEQDKINKRKMGYRYELDIYQIFEKFEENGLYESEENGIYEIEKYHSMINEDEMLNAIQEYYSIGTEKTRELLKIWIDNWLVSEWEGKYSIGLILTFTK